MVPLFLSLGSVMCVAVDLCLEGRRKNDGKSRCRHSEIGFTGEFIICCTVFACTNILALIIASQMRDQYLVASPQLSVNFPTCRL